MPTDRLSTRRSGPELRSGTPRRSVLKGAVGASAIGLPLATVLADPRLARAQADALETVFLTVPGGRTVSAALGLPDIVPAGAVLLIHEWWGLNDQVKAVAAEIAAAGYIALAVDLMGGAVATTPDAARAQTQAVDPAEATETLVAWIEWLKALDAGNGGVVTLGWCFGGGWSLNAALATPVDGTVVYYGRVPDDPEALANLSGPVLGHFATRDGFIDEAMVGGFTAAMQEAGKPFDIHWYVADHAFANPTGGAYDADDASLAWSRTLTFIRAVLG